MVEASLEPFNRMEVLRCQADHLVNTAAGLYIDNGALAYYDMSMKHQCVETVGLNVAGRMYAESCAILRDDSLQVGRQFLTFCSNLGWALFRRSVGVGFTLLSTTAGIRDVSKSTGQVDHHWESGRRARTAD